MAPQRVTTVSAILVGNELRLSVLPDAQLHGDRDVLLLIVEVESEFSQLYRYGYTPLASGGFVAPV